MLLSYIIRTGIHHDG